MEQAMLHFAIDYTNNTICKIRLLYIEMWLFDLTNSTETSYLNVKSNSFT